METTTIIYSINRMNTRRGLCRSCMTKSASPSSSSSTGKKIKSIVETKTPEELVLEFQDKLSELTEKIGTLKNKAEKTRGDILLLQLYLTRAKEIKSNIKQLNQIIKQKNQVLMRELESEANRLGGKKKRVGLKK